MKSFLFTVCQIIKAPRVHILIGFFFVLGISLTGISNHAFWDDEANTALFARNLIEQGQLSAWDGNNVIGYKGGYELNEDLVNVIIPPLQYYIAAAGMIIFGENEFGARIPFVLFGALSVLILGWAAKGFLSDHRNHGLPALIAATSTAFLLYIPQARYYSLGLFFTALILGLWGEGISKHSNSKDRFIAITALGAVFCAGLFYANYLY